MKSYTCKKCNKSFNNSYNLSQHLNKKISCDTILQCKMCHKVFPTNFQLTNHLNRKTPCVKKEVEDKEDKKHKQKLELLEKELEILDKKHKQKLELLELKQKTPQIINNTNTTVINYPTINVYNYNHPDILNEYNKNNFIKLFEYLLEDKRSFKDMMVKFLEYTHNNEDYPQCRNIIYAPGEDNFYGIEDGEWKKQEFTTVYPILSETMYKLWKSVYKDYNDKIKHLSISDEILKIKIPLINFLNNHKVSKTKKEIKDCAEKALIEKEDDDFDY